MILPPPIPTRTDTLVPSTPRFLSRPFAGTDPAAALFHYSRDRRGEHPRAHLASWSGILQADAYGGYGELYRRGASLLLCAKPAASRMRGASSSNWTMSKARRAGRAGVHEPR